MAPTVVTESLRAQLDRETGEYAQLIGADRDALLAEIANAESVLAGHTKAERAAGIAAASDKLAALQIQRAALATVAAAKLESVRDCERKLAVEKRHQALAHFRAAVTAADPLAATVSKAMYGLIAAMQALTENRHTAATALDGWPDDQVAFGGTASMHAAFGDIDFHLRAALALPQPSGPVRGDADTQQLTVRQFAATLR